MNFVNFHAIMDGRDDGLEKAARPAYLSAMGFFQNASPRHAASDLVAFFRNTGFNPLVLLLACVPAVVLVAAVYFDARNKSKPPPPEVFYFESWSADRTRAESEAYVIEKQKPIDEAKERSKDAYRALGRAVGMDVEEIEREAKADRAAAEKARAEAAKAGEAK